MDIYSHGSFQVSGLKVTIKNKEDAQEIIKSAWNKFMKEGLFKQIEHKTYLHVHAVYYNYNFENGLAYDMLIGFVTEENSTQTNSEFINLTIPPQDYKYVKFDSDNFEKDLIIEWDKINAMSNSELNRNFQYDLEMYSEDYKSCTLAVSVNKEG